jgi:DNA polymerase-3 subunit epsilon
VHGQRVREVLAPWRLPPWPHPAAVACVERDAAHFREDWHVFDRWCWLGTVRTLDAALALAQSAPRRFEADAYRIIRRALARAAGADVVTLWNRAPVAPAEAVEPAVS